MSTMSDKMEGCEEESDDVVQADHPNAVSICAIDKKSVHRICSGQVVLTLATAVKELLENSIDAKATIVEIKLKDYGSESVEVSDNGIGVESSNFEGLTLKHHTSKIQDFGDLVNVETFGFRGEALSSLCALCDMAVTTRHQAASVGTKLQFDNNGRITKRTPQARQMGTTVSLQNLFYTLPVRHKEFRRNLKKEFVKMVQVLNSYCIVSTGVKISCNNQTGKGSRAVVVSTNGNNTLQENIANVFGPKQMQSLLEFIQKVPGEEVCSEFGLKTQQPSMFSIDGYVSKCEHGLGRSSTDRQFYFINGRPFDSTKLTKVVNEVYHQYNRHQYPFVALRIQVEKESVDVNVTPDKRQVFLEREKQLLAIVKTSLTSLYEPTTSVLQMQMPMAKFNMDEYVLSTSQRQFLSTIEGNRGESLHVALRLSVSEGVQTMYTRYQDSKWNQVQEKARSIASALQDTEDGHVTSSPQSPGGSTKTDKAAGMWSSAFCNAKEKDDDDQPYTKISRHPSLEKPNGLSSLQKLKRSFSSAFAKDTSHQAGSEIPKGDQSGNLSKQRKLDGFVSSFNYSPKKTDSSPSIPHNQSITRDSEDCFIIPHIKPHTLVTEHKHSIDGNRLSCDQNSSESQIDETGDAKNVNLETESFRNTCATTEKRTPCDRNGDTTIRSAGFKIEMHEFESECVGTISSETLIIPHNQVSDLDKTNGNSTERLNSEEQGSSDVLHQNMYVSGKEKNDDIRKDTSVVSLEDQDSNLSESIQEEHCFDEIEDTDKKERNVTFSFKYLKEKMESKRDDKDGKFSRAFRAKICPGDNQAAEQELQREIKKEMFSKMEILGQFNKGFIITRLEDDLFIVDQHATDEKFNFETLQRDTIIQSQKLICPQNLGLTASNEIILMDNLDTFRKNGFEFTIDENGQPTERVKLTSTPVSKNWLFGKEDIEEMLFMLSDSPGVMCRPTRVRAMFASRSCRKSVMIGTTLNKSEMKKLVCHMGEIEQPWNCPHGRPTMRHLINLDMVPR